LFIKYLQQINFFSYRGRIGRQTYIFLSLILTICSLLLIVGGLGLFYTFLKKGFFNTINLSEKWPVGVLLILSSVLVNVLFSFIAVKRLHDIQWSGWLCLLLFLHPTYKLFYQYMLNGIRILEVELLILGISVIMYIILLFKKGSEGDNVYGPDPLKRYRKNNE